MNKNIIVNDLNELIVASINDISINNVITVWRGQSNSQYEPIPGIYRRLLKNGYNKEEITEDLVKKYEEDMFCSANGLGVYGETGGNRLELMIQMQHFGAATRFLDVSSNPFVAFWFAAKHDDTQGVVFRYEINTTCIANYDRVRSWDTITDLSLSGCPILFIPKRINERIIAQSSAFLTTVIQQSIEAGSIFTTNGELIKITKIVFPGSIKKDIREFLHNCRNISYFDVFPDIQGFAAANASTQSFERKEDELFNAQDSSGLFPPEYSINNK